MKQAEVKELFEKTTALMLAMQEDMTIHQLKASVNAFIKDLETYITRKVEE